FPAVWPETFSYTLSIAMKSNLYPVAFDFGAIAERLRRLEWGELLALELMGQSSVINDCLLSLQRVSFAGMLPDSSPQALYPDFVTDYYALDRSFAINKSTAFEAVPASPIEVVSTIAFSETGK